MKFAWNRKSSVLFAFVLVAFILSATWGCKEDEKKEEEPKEEGVISFEDPEDEQLDLRTLKSPEDPTHEEVEEHWASGHVQQRNLRPHCVKCRARSDPHRKPKERKQRGSYMSAPINTRHQKWL